MLVGTATAAVLAERQETGKLRLRLHAVVDAKSVFDSVANVSSIKVSDEHLLIHILKVREFITRGIVFSAVVVRYARHGIRWPNKRISRAHRHFIFM